MKIVTNVVQYYIILAKKVHLSNFKTVINKYKLFYIRLKAVRKCRKKCLFTIQS